VTDTQQYKVILVIPVHNDRPRIRALIRQVVDLQLSLLVIDDGSEDGLCAEDVAPARFVSYQPNGGKGMALKTGLSLARELGFDYAVTLDCDGQHPVGCIPDFLAKIESPIDFVVGRRHWNPRNMPWPRLFSNTVTSWLMSLRTGEKIYDSQNGFRCYPLGASDLWASGENGFQFESAVFIQAHTLGLKLKWVEVPVVYADSPSQIRHVVDTLKFIRFYYRSIWRE